MRSALRCGCGRVPGAHVDLCDLVVGGHLASFGLPWRRRAGCQVSSGVTRGSAITQAASDPALRPAVQRCIADGGCEVRGRRLLLSRPGTGSVVSGPAGGVVDGVVADQGVGDAGGAVRQCAGDHAAAFAAIPEALGVGLGRRIGHPQPHTEVDQRPA